MALPNPSMSFSPFAILTAEEMNDLVENIESLASGTGINDGTLTNAKLSTSAGEIGGAWVTWSPTVVGFSSTTISQYYWKKIGKTIFFYIAVSGTSNSTSFTITLPTAAVTGHISNIEGFIALALNAGSVVTTSPRWEVVPATSATVMNLFTSVGGGSWTASGTKIAQFSGFYEAA